MSYAWHAFVGWVLFYCPSQLGNLKPSIIAWTKLCIDIKNRILSILFLLSLSLGEDLFFFFWKFLNALYIQVVKCIDFLVFVFFCFLVLYCVSFNILNQIYIPFGVVFLFFFVSVVFFLHSLCCEVVIHGSIPYCILQSSADFLHLPTFLQNLIILIEDTLPFYSGILSSLLKSAWL